MSWMNCRVATLQETQTRQFANLLLVTYPGGPFRSRDGVCRRGSIPHTSSPPSASPTTSLRRPIVWGTVTKKSPFSLDGTSIVFPTRKDGRRPTSKLARSHSTPVPHPVCHSLFRYTKRLGEVPRSSFKRADQSEITGAPTSPTSQNAPGKIFSLAAFTSPRPSKPETWRLAT